MFYFFIVNMFFEICYFNTITNSDECALAHSGAVYAPLRSVLNESHWDSAPRCFATNFAHERAFTQTEISPSNSCKHDLPFSFGLAELLSQLNPTIFCDSL